METIKILVKIKIDTYYIMRILLLIIYSDNDPAYIRMRDIQRKYVNKYENVDTYFMQSSYLHNEEVYIDNDMSFVRCPEEHHTILYKTLSTLDCLTNFFKKEYDFVIRSNISTIINIPKLLEMLSFFVDKEYLYGGDIAGVHNLNRDIRFALGTCIIISKSLYKKMTSELNKFTDKIADDVAIGLYVQDNCPEAYDHNLSTKSYTIYTHTLANGWNSNVNDFIDFMNKNPDRKDFYICYRNKTSSRNEDANIMEYICDNILD